MFGEDFLMFQRENQYTIKAESIKVNIVYISYEQLKREYKRLI